MKKDNEIENKPLSQISIGELKDVLKKYITYPVGAVAVLMAISLVYIATTAKKSTIEIPIPWSDPLKIQTENSTAKPGDIRLNQPMRDATR